MENLDKDFKKLAKRSKIKRVILTVVISFVVLIGGALGIVTFLNARAEKNSQALYRAQSIYNEIATPNLVSYGEVASYGTFTSASSTSKYTKNIDGYQQSWGTLNFSVNTIFTSPIQYVGNNITQYNGGNYSTDTGKKIATFFTVGYTDMSGGSTARFDGGTGGITVTHEASTLKDMPKHLAEVAVTFDKPYSYDEIQKMVPKNLMINWYWIGLNAKKIDASSLPLYIGINSDLGVTAQTYKDYGLYDQPDNTVTLDSVGEWNNYAQFAMDVKAAKNYLTSFVPSDSGSSTFYLFEDAAKQIQKYPTLDKAKFAGVILTGRTENFANLDSQKWVYATNVGATTEVVPYIKPIK